VANLAPVSIALLGNGPTIDSRTITVYLQLAFGTGYYNTGGIPAGIAAFINDLTVNTSNPLWAEVHSEDVVGSTSASLGNYYYIYNFTYDTIQIFDGPADNATELQASQLIPVGVLTDTIVGRFTYNRIPQ
jgi:hypothetical protein